jgi:hypothetical protein
MLLGNDSHIHIFYSRDQTVVLGLSPRDLSKQKASHATLEVQAESLRSSWKENKRGFEEEYNSVVKRTANSMASEFDANLTLALRHQASTSNSKVDQPVSSWFPDSGCSSNI